MPNALQRHSKKIILCVAVLALLAGGAFWYHKHEAAAAKAAADKAAAQAPAEVVVRSLKKEDVPIFEELPGRTTAHKVAEIRPQVSGIILKRLFEEGSDVKEGQQLYQINPDPFQATLNSAKADLLKAQANLKSVEAKTSRYQQLIKLHAISQQDYDDAIASYEQAKADIAIAQAAVETAQINLDFTRVYAPISGRVGKSNVTEGALVTAGQADSMATVTQLDPIYVDLTQSSDALMRMRDKISDKEKTTVNLILENHKDTYPQQGTVQFSDVTVDPTTGMVELRAIFPNPQHALLPGLFVRARVNLDTLHTIVVPQSAAIRNTDGSLAVWKVTADKKLALTPIQTDRAVNGTWVVTSGVEEGDTIVVSGFQKAAAGAAVKTITEEEAKKRAEEQKAKDKDKDKDKADAKADAAKNNAQGKNTGDKKDDKDSGNKDAANKPDAATDVPPVKNDTSPLPATDETSAVKAAEQPKNGTHPADMPAPNAPAPSFSEMPNTVPPEAAAHHPAPPVPDKVPALEYNPNDLPPARNPANNNAAPAAGNTGNDSVTVPAEK